MNTSDVTCSEPLAFPTKRYLTPANTPTSFICRRILIPDVAEYRAAFGELISRICFPEVWEQREGGMTPLEAAALAALMDVDLEELRAMIGAIIPMCTDVLPGYMLWADGAVYERVNFPDLYGRLPASLIIDADYFYVPDLRGRVVVGSGSDGTLTDRAVGDVGGEETHQLTTDEMPAHQHSIPSIADLNAVNTGDLNTTLLFVPGATLDTTSSGGDQAHNNMPPYFALKFAIVAKSRDCC